jgi:hexosaminidase
MSKGRNYTLSFSVKPTSSTPGTLFSSSTSSLLARNCTSLIVMLATGGNAYVLNYTLPVNRWMDDGLVGINNATYLSVSPPGSSDSITCEFTATIGDYSKSVIWGNPMAIEAPVAVIGGDLFQGQMENVSLVDRADPKYAAG